VECRIKRADGSYGWFEVSAVGQLSEQALEGAILTLHDVSERRELTNRLMHQAHHDTLTGLPNRALLTQRIDEALRRRDRAFGLLLLDLDDFKVINDRHGHASGDVVLTVIGQRLTGLVRAGDTVARLGGDEFAYLVHGGAAELRAVAERLVEAIEQPVAVGGRRFHVRTSIGIVLAGDGDAESAQSLMSHADIALYEAKARDKGGIVLIAGAERDDAAKQVHLREQIAQPDLDQFTVVYQPIVDLGTGQLRGVEALLRWEHPETGLVYPGDFMHLAEITSLILPIGVWTLRTACAQVKKWQEEGHPHLSVAVNLSARQFQQVEVVEHVKRALRETGLSARSLDLEITESHAMANAEATIHTLRELKALGVRISIDDFGIGYSSLNYLKRLPIDTLKIDQSFVRDITSDPDDAAIATAVIALAHTLKLRVVAEGVETQEQLAFLAARHCDRMQGYLFSRPLQSQECGEFLGRTGRDS
jgi:diguanylate cyclase (GGDEF)-like protein